MRNKFLSCNCCSLLHRVTQPLRIHHCTHNLSGAQPEICTRGLLRGFGALSPALKDILYFFSKNNLIFGKNILIKINAKLLKRGIEIRGEKHDYILA